MTTPPLGIHTTASPPRAPPPLPHTPPPLHPLGWLRGTKVALTFDKETAAFTGKLANYTHLKQYNDGGFTVTLSDRPAGGHRPAQEQQRQGPGGL